MGLIASLDMGSEKMVMALATGDHHSYRLTGIKFVASQGIERGVIADQTKVRACVRNLAQELVKERNVERLNIALPGNVLRMTERRVMVPLQRKVVERGDMERAEQKCSDGFSAGSEELIDILPVAYSVDRGEAIANPLGRQGRNLEVIYQVYTADSNYLTGIRRMFDGCGFEEICFFPSVRAYSEAGDAGKAESDFAIVDLGAMSIKVALFREGLMEYEATLPMGVKAIDYDIMSAFAINEIQARKLKHEYGQALRSVCKNKKVIIPDTNLTAESRDLATVVQCRSEELLEGVVYLLQHWGFEDNSGEIWLTGGGSRLLDMDVLLHRMAGHPVSRARVKRVQTTKEEVLRTPEYFVALGLLMCDRQEPQEQSPGWLSRIKELFS